LVAKNLLVKHVTTDGYATRVSGLQMAMNTAVTRLADPVHKS